MENIHVLINSFSFNLKVRVTKYEMLCYKVVLSKSYEIEPTQGENDVQYNKMSMTLSHVMFVLKFLC